jgi:predicted DNA-binding WGR domain protein
MREATIKQALEDGAGSYYVIWIDHKKDKKIHIAWGRQRMTTLKANSLENHAKEKIPGQSACEVTFSGGKRRQTKPAHLYRKFKDKTEAKDYFKERVAKKRRLGYRGCKLDFARKDLAVPISGIIMDGNKKNMSTGVFVEQRSD